MARGASRPPSPYTELTNRWLPILRAGTLLAPQKVRMANPSDESLARLGSPLVLGTIVDRSVAPRVALSMLRDLFGLTESEARVAEAYLRVDTVKDVAEQLGVSVNTVKTHMAATYLKTGCTRQAQLVRLLMTLAEMSENGSPG